VKRKAVLIVWDDASDHSPGEWCELPKKDGARITTVGILVRKTPKTFLIAQSFDDNDDPLYRGVFSIPRANVVEMRTLDG
jgi:signal transduction protein with GAF and PtsI domain